MAWQICLALVKVGVHFEPQTWSELKFQGQAFARHRLNDELENAQNASIDKAETVRSRVKDKADRAAETQIKHSLIQEVVRRLTDNYTIAGPDQPNKSTTSIWHLISSARSLFRSRRKDITGSSTGSALYPLARRDNMSEPRLCHIGNPLQTYIDWPDDILLYPCLNIFLEHPLYSPLMRLCCYCQDHVSITGRSISLISALEATCKREDFILIRLCGTAFEKLGCRLPTKRVQLKVACHSEPGAFSVSGDLSRPVLVHIAMPFPVAEDEGLLEPSLETTTARSSQGECSNLAGCTYPIKPVVHGLLSHLFPQNLAVLFRRGSRSSCWLFDSEQP